MTSIAAQTKEAKVIWGVFPRQLKHSSLKNNASVFQVLSWPPRVTPVAVSGPRRHIGINRLSRRRLAVRILIRAERKEKVARSRGITLPLFIFRLLSAPPPPRVGHFVLPDRNKGKPSAFAHLNFSAWQENQHALKKNSHRSSRRLLEKKIIGHLASRIQNIGSVEALRGQTCYPR